MIDIEKIQKLESGQRTQSNNKEYSITDAHKFNVRANTEDCCLVELLIGEDKYKLLRDEQDNNFLQRYNERYKMWVELKFTGTSVDIQTIIINALQKQYINRIATNK